MRFSKSFGTATGLILAASCLLAAPAARAQSFINVLTGGTSGVYYPLGVAIGIVDVDFHQEAVELRFGQRVSAFLLERVLGGHHEKRRFERAQLAAGGDLFFLHGFQQGTLHFCRGTVNFIRQDKVGEDRTASYHKFILLLVVNHSTDHVRRQQVRCKLNTAEFTVNGGGKGFDGQGFCQTGNTFQQYVALCQQPYQQSFYHVTLPYDDFAQFQVQQVYKCACLVDFFI